MLTGGMIASFLLAAAAAAVPAQRAPRPPEPPVWPTCEHVGGALTYLATEPRVARQGATIAVRPVYRDGPDGEKDVPERCLKKWKVEGEGIRFDRKRRTVEIASDAAPGSTPALSVMIGGQKIGTRFRIVGINETVLTGKWHPTRLVNCGRPELGEIEFGDTDRYVFTFREQMIETMTSGSGNYRWDSATGALELGFLDKGSFVARQKGTAQMIGGRLVIEGIDFGDRPPPYPAPPGEPQPPPLPPCRMEF